MGRKMKEKQELEAKMQESIKLKEKEYLEGQIWFKDRKT